MLNITIQRLFKKNYFVAENVAKLALRAPDYCFGYRYHFLILYINLRPCAYSGVEKSATNM